ncbi:MAG: META domain-containing protein [Bacteroidota bacterium]
MLRALALLLALSLTACDGFGPSDALPDLGDGSTDPALLLGDTGWVAIAAVSDGEAVEFPATGFTAQFTADGIVGGRTSANQYGGDYEASGDGAFDARDLITTLVGESPRAEQLSAVLLRELAEAATFEIQGETLQVRSADGDGIRFERSGAE